MLRQTVERAQTCGFCGASSTEFGTSRATEAEEQKSGRRPDTNPGLGLGNGIRSVRAPLVHRGIGVQGHSVASRSSSQSSNDVVGSALRVPALEVSGLTHNFGATVALDGVDFEVHRGEVLGLLGPNGAGKTTTIRVLATLLRPDAGTARVLGRDVVEDPVGVRSVIGFAGQMAAVDGVLSPVENLEIVATLAHVPRRQVKTRVAELIEAFDLGEVAHRRAATLSGGMRRRLDLAAALVHRPPILFLDEPTTGLDPRSRVSLWSLIETLVEHGMTVLLTSQYLEEVDRLADRVVIIDHGQVVASGTPDELKSHIGGDVIEMQFGSVAVAAAAVAVLEQVGEATASGASVVLRVEAVAAGVMAACRTLDAAGIRPDDLAVRGPTMDDVFMQLTREGRS